MEFDFVLPQKHEDLLNTTGNCYCVNHIINEKECGEKLRLARLALTEHGTTFIFDHYDVFHSIIVHCKHLQSQTIFRAMDLLYKSVDALGKVLAEFLQQSNSSVKERHGMLNALKMLIYSQVTLVKFVDKEVITNDGKKSKKQSPEDLTQGKWEEMRYSALLQLFNILQLPLGGLWDPPIAEEPFVNLCGDFAYRTLDHPSIKSSNVHDTSFQILGTLLKNYNHALVFPIQIFELLKSSEMSAIAIANGVPILAENFGIQTIVKVIIDQIVSGLDNSSGGSVVKNISAFLTELGNVSPKLVMPYIRDIADELLNLESYLLRICVLQVMTEILVGELNGEELSQEEKDTRDEYLDNIFEHIHDVNAHVRSKALGMWIHLKQENAIPLVWITPVLDRATMRLEDRSNLVRKNVIILIKSFLERNPYAAKLSLEELEQRYEEKLKELSDFREKMTKEADKMDEVNEKWDEVLIEMKPFIISCLALESIKEEGIRPEDCDNLFLKFPQMLADKEYERLILLTRRAEELNGNWETIKEMEPIHAQVYFAMLLKSYYMLQNSCKSYEEEYKKTDTAVRFLENSLEFSRVIVNAVPKLQELLMSKVESDVTEAINFFTSAYQFGIKNTESGMCQLLYLVWTVSKDKRGPVRDAYKCVLFTTDHQGRAHDVKAVNNLMRFIEKVTFSQFVAFEELLREFLESGDIGAGMIQVMFEIYTKKLDNVTNNDSRLALQLLVICSSAKPEIAIRNSSIIEKLCFEDQEGEKDSRIYTLTLDFLMNVHGDKDENTYKRLNGDDQKVANVIAMYRKYFLNDQTMNFDDVCSKTFQFIYKMCHLPNIISQELIKDLWNEILLISKDLQVDGCQNEGENNPSEIISQNPTDVFSQLTQETANNTLLKMPMKLASRFIFMLGYVAMKELIYLDVDIFSNLKHRQDLTSHLKSKKGPVDKLRNSIANMSASSVKRRSTIHHAPGEEEENPEEDIVGQSTDDAFADQINSICEKEMLFHKDSIFRRFIPMIVDFLKHPAKYNHPELQRSALLSLLHFMSVSSEFCEKYMQFLMNVFQHNQDIDIKCNVIIGMSDLTFRFPNVIEPWSGHLYSTLYDENRDLRLTSVRILSHLISHEMILVKGQISDLAMCLVDKDDEIRSTTEVFFKEIANKSNILYNVLPDIISRLSDPKLKLEEGKYQIIMKYIMGLIHKDRQVEGLVEKLCFRFKVTEQERQWRDISYCLSLLTYTEKTIKKLTDNIILFKDKVQVDEVYEYFKQIISNTSKLAKPELKAVVQDFEMKLEECLAVNDNPAITNDDNQETIKRRIKLPVDKRPGRSKTNKKVPQTRGRNRKAAEENSESSLSSSSSDSELENHPPRRQKGARKVEPRKIINTDSEEEVASTANKRQTSVRARRITKVVQEETSSGKKRLSENNSF
ncbi:CLUMA_CG005410, isoform A [Clunio marinus]|uniref:Condensin complex subunit 1 n=1 Tax=Clunio marinus TaxID=568069 RepID=A0A1J1HW51_9DIPT|nr:CLUMA_CG005410, isoform A [Clunio marinus]